MVNDTYGHDVGDKVLKNFTKVIQKTLRSDAYLARVGGEEFSILLPNTSKDVAIDIASRILKQVENIDFTDLHVDLKITVSIGLSTYKKECTIESMLKNADKKLYEAKNSGRNKVCF